MLGWLGTYRVKLILFIFGVIFAAIEIPLFIVWVREVGGLHQANDLYFQQMFDNELFKMTIIDLTATTFIIFAWMLLDSLRSRQFWLPLLAFIMMAFSPTVGFLFYLLFRQNRPFCPMEQPAGTGEENPP